MTCSVAFVSYDVVLFCRCLLTMLALMNIITLLGMVSFISLIKSVWVQMTSYTNHNRTQVLFPDDSYLPPNLPPLVDVLRNSTEFTRLVALIEVSLICG